MTLPTQRDVAAVDPVLTNMLVGYQQSDDRFIATRLFPGVEVEEFKGTYYEYPKKYFFKDGLLKRAPGDSFASIGIGVSSATYLTEQWGREGKVPVEVEASNQAPMGPEQATTLALAQMSNIRKEVALAAAAFVTSVWGTDQAGGASGEFTKWSDYANSDPVGNIDTASDTVDTNTGMAANTLAMGKIVHRKLRNHPDVINRIVYTQQATQANITAALAAIFGVQNYWVSKAVQNTGNLGQSATMAAIIDDDCLVCHVATNNDLFNATAGKTFFWPDGGGLGDITPYWKQENRSNMLQIAEQWDIKVVASDTGYLFNDIVD